LNGDGVPDLAVTNNEGNSFSVLLGNGDGTFKAHTDYATGQFPNSVAVGDFNQDGKIDIAVSNYLDDIVDIYAGNGDGTFKSRVHFGTAASPSWIIADDVNADGHIDLITTNFLENGSSAPGDLCVLLGRGDGTFLARVDYDAGYGPFGVAVADFNLDGVTDVAAANSDSSISVLLGDGSGAFQNYLSASAGKYSVCGDGRGF